MISLKQIKVGEIVIASTTPLRKFEINPLESGAYNISFLVPYIEFNHVLRIYTSPSTFGTILPKKNIIVNEILIPKNVENTQIKDTFLENNKSSDWLLVSSMKS